ncbi:MAG: Asp-tRNA(Asn)/Glu-tRNA(Gln) amidotransferase subunit GatC [Gammaproteobacteria bacterium]|jgi:aspartyl-tRNA(Asn)/glutamyl-tRNA(Gln) amidotransferase subunit C|nr:Asp-tRNA(Asn)/Glu-tRNA(Gln) amidotransferase subunit GatC [Gammaproteobacteria bacterium]
MSLNDGDVKRIARLARLEIGADDVPRYAHDLSAILAFVEQMGSVDTGAVAPMAHPLDAVQRLREDAVTEDDARAAFQAIAPQVERGLYLVPKVIE